MEALQLYTVGVCLVSVIIVGLQWSIEVSYECIWSFSVLLIEAVASGQLEEIFVLSGITDLWVVFCRFVWVTYFGEVLGKPDVMFRDLLLVHG